MNKLTDILDHFMHVKSCPNYPYIVNGERPIYPCECEVPQAEAAINQYISENLNKLNPPVWKHDNGKAYYMFEVEKLDKFLSSITAKGDNHHHLASQPPPELSRNMYTCGACGKTFESNPNPTACAVLHAPGQCCHYNDKVIT